VKTACPNAKMEVHGILGFGCQYGVAPESILCLLRIHGFHIPPFPSACWSRCLFFFLFIMHHKYILSIFMPSSHLHTGNKCLDGVDQAAIRKDTKRVVREKLSISNMSTDQQHLLGSVFLLLGQWNHDTTRVTAPEALSPSSPRNRSRD
jgi:hypothetical protein